MFELDECIYYMATLGLKKVTDTYNESFKKHDATRVQWIALYYIHKSQGIRQMDLADLMQAQETTIARLITRMVSNKLIEKRADPTDKRAVKLYCTEEGKKKFNILLPVCSDFYNNIIKDIPPQDMEVFKRVLDKLVENSQKPRK